MAKHSDRRKPPEIHRGADHSAPYPVSRLAPSFGLVDLARELEQADQAVAGRLGAQLQVIAEQVRALQAQARRVLEAARDDQRLHHARCAFQRRPGQVYHLYQEADGVLALSLLSPDDWDGRPPHTFLGSYRLEHDLSWTPADSARPDDDGRQLVARLLSAGDDVTDPGTET